MLNVCRRLSSGVRLRPPRRRSSVDKMKWKEIKNIIYLIPLIKRNVKRNSPKRNTIRKESSQKDNTKHHDGIWFICSNSSFTIGTFESTLYCMGTWPVFKCATKRWCHWMWQINSIFRNISHFLDLKNYVHIIIM